MKKVCIVGHFGFGKNLLNGQTIKTKVVASELERQLGKNKIMKIDTHGGLKNLPKMVFWMVRAFAQCDNIVILPAHNGIKIFVPICTLLNKIYRRKLHYVVIGGWISSYLDNKKFLKEMLKHFDGIYVETSTMKKSLNRLGFNNIYIVPNFKDIKIIEKSEFPREYDKPYKLCTFSRVMKQKGIEDAVYAIEKINNSLGYEAYTLDIYGQIEFSEEEWFARLKNEFSPAVTYKGEVPFDESVNVLKNYFMLLFPTRFYTEGIPGTILDAYIAGIPVVAARWESFEDLIDEGKTGFGYDFNDIYGIERILKEVLIDASKVLCMKENCILKAKQFSSQEALKVLINKL